MQDGHIDVMHRLEAPHDQLHEVIRQMIQSKNSGDAQEAAQHFSQIEELSKQIMSLLDQVQTSS